MVNCRLLILMLSVLSMVGCRKSSSTTARAQATMQLYGHSFSAEQLDTLSPYLERNAAGFDSMRSVGLDERTLPAMTFNPLPLGFKIKDYDSYFKVGEMFGDETEVHRIQFATIGQLASLLRNGEVTSEELVQHSISRIKKFDPQLHCTITLLEEEALQNARKADLELQAGKDRGLLHGIPYGIKDLFALAGHPTTWGAEPYRDQVLDYTASVINKLDDAGAVLVAKLTSGALARGDVWFDGTTRNPWDTLQGASGSSAGSGAAVSAGLLPFAIGTETLGSIVSPCTRTGISGLRPTYGRVSRYGCMSLSWSMDKVGPMTRSAEDCAIVFHAIQGVDSLDPSTIEAPFKYPIDQQVKSLRIGFLGLEIQKDTTGAGDNLRLALDRLEEDGIDLIPCRLPETLPSQSFDIILRAEAGAFFDELVLSGQVDEMVQQSARSRANSLRQSRFIPAVEYLQANRHRALLIQRMHELMVNFDAIITPTFGGKQLMITNLTGHPAVVVPTGLDDDEHPTSMTIIGNLFEEEKILALADYFQQLTDFHKQTPPGF